MSSTDYDLPVAYAEADAGRDRYKAGLPAVTSYTINQRTRGIGFLTVNYTFDVVFANEPVFSYGTSLVGIDLPGYMPIGHAMVLRWRRNDRHAYLGAALALYAEVRFEPLFSADGRPYVAPGGSDSPAAVPTIAHHLTFSGVAHQPNSAEVSTLMQTAASHPTSVGVR